MVRLALFLLLAAPAAALPAQAPAPAGWDLATMPNGCMVQATSPQGTMLSIWGFAGESKLGFLLQNRDWETLREGQNYTLSLDFVGVRSLPVQAVAHREIDEDGPGFFFSVAPGASAGDGFLDAFASASGLGINQGGRKVDTLSLAGGREAIASLARCLADRWSSAPAQAADSDEHAPAALPTT